MIEKYYSQFLRTNPYPRHLINYKETLINFSSSDYLGLSKHPLLSIRAFEYTQKYGTGSSGSRMVTGNLPCYPKLEEDLARALNKPAALIMNSGFQTNLSVLHALLDPVILGKQAIVFIDRFAHISLLQGARFATKLHRFKHNNLDHLESLLSKYKTSSIPKFIIVESLYSMDGDSSDLKSLIQLAKHHGAFLYVDDAHSVGVEGLDGWGKATLFADQIDIIMGTFSKGLGCYGSYLGCSQTIKDYLINKCKGLIYSTSLPPSVLGSIDAAMEVNPTLNHERSKIISYSQWIRGFFQNAQLNCGSTNSHIIPWIIGDPDKTLKASQLLQEYHILGVTIRPPSVRVGESRIRFCVSSSHSESDIHCLIDSIRKVAQKL